MEDPFDTVSIPVLSLELLMRKPVAVTPLPVLPMAVEPTCRYGHGLLEAASQSYSMRGVASADITEEGCRVFTPAMNQFRVDLWRCPECRYIEMFDAD